MRMLFSYMGGSGHLGPLTPLARASIDAGHQVLFIAQPFTASQIERAGFDFVRAPDTSKDPNGWQCGRGPRRLTRSPSARTS
jgi:UDP:flavonoid glycosyltransferase YjiC (YdhE family)